MHIPFFGIEAPDGIGTIFDRHHAPDSSRAVACIATAVGAGHLEGGGALARFFDERTAALLEVFVKAGVPLVCLEAMQGSAGRLDAMGASVGALLRRGKVQVWGVDDLALERRMVEALNEAASARAGNDRLLARVDGLFDDLLAGSPPSAAVELLKIRERPSGSPDLYEAAKGLLSLEKRLPHRLPADLKRALLALVRQRECDQDIAMLEQEELLRRLKRHAQLGLLDPGRATTFRTPPADSTLVTTETDLGVVRMPAHDRAALAHCRALAGVGGDFLATSYTMQEYQVYQSSNLFPRNRHVNPLSSDVDQNTEVAKRALGLARLLGVDLSSYPNLRKLFESCQALQPLAGKDIYKVLAQLVRGAWDAFSSLPGYAPGEAALIACARQLRLLSKLARLELAPEDYDQAVEEIDDASMSRILETLADQGGRVESGLLEEARRFDERRDLLLSFYQNARRRASGMAAGTLRRMEELGMARAVLVCLGFHVPTVRATWAGEGVSFLFLHPSHKDLPLPLTGGKP